MNEELGWVFIKVLYDTKCKSELELKSKYKNKQLYFPMSIKMAVTFDYRHNNIRYFSSKMHI